MLQRKPGCRQLKDELLTGGGGRGQRAEDQAAAELMAAQDAADRSAAQPSGLGNVHPGSVLAA